VTYFHYTTLINLPSIFQKRALLPSPPLALYGLTRDAVEANPGAHGFCVYRSDSRRVYDKQDVPHFDYPQVLDDLMWYEGERFAVAFTAAPWCGTALGYMPPDAREGGVAYRLVVDLDGLDTFGWERWQQTVNVPGPARRKLGELARAKGGGRQGLQAAAARRAAASRPASGARGEETGADFRRAMGLLRGRATSVGPSPSAGTPPGPRAPGHTAGPGAGHFAASEGLRPGGRRAAAVGRGCSAGPGPAVSGPSPW
jgi:hypothetical protein